MGNKNFEAVMGALVLVVAGLFLLFAYQGSNLKSVDGYKVKAKFTTVAGIGLGTDVRIGGIKVGVVNDLRLDPETYQAIVTLLVKQEIKLPVDSSAAVVSDGLLGNKYIKIEPGADEKFLAAGGEIVHSQSSVNLEELIGKMAFGGVDKKAEKPASSADVPANPQK